ncbi:MAG: menaquinone biosynthesis protein [Phycisphaerales bacterium]|nr:menaquinone biosynthesis protein [Phycisphaerales bacterium]
MSRTESLAPPSIEPTLPRMITVGAVDYLNTIPLIAGLEGLETLEVRTDVPANQVGMLQRDAVDLALCSSIDLVRCPEPLMAVPVGMLGCAGPTLTVRLLSRRPLSELSRVACDRESHTSVQLLRVFLREVHGVEPELVDLDAGMDGIRTDAAMDALLLIGDKVVTATVPEAFHEHEVDLGEAWFEMTGLPFVFATWLCRVNRTPEELERVRLAARILDRTRLRNKSRISRLAAIHAPIHGWPVELARRYFVENLIYDFDERAMAGLRLFIELSEGRDRPVRILEDI